MEILPYRSYIQALSTSYEGDADIKFIGLLDTTEEGLSFYRENYLRNCTDRRINNYSCLYLTNKQKLTDFIKIKQLSNNNNYKIFNSSIIDDKTGLYLTLSSSIEDTLSTYPQFTKKTDKFIDLSDKIFEITIFNNCSATIAHKSKNRGLYYLSVNYNSSLSFDYTNFVFSLSPSKESTILDCMLDEENNKLSIFKTISGKRYLIFLNNDTKLSATSTLSSFHDKNFNINYYIKGLEPKINTSWVSYNINNINNYEINLQKSRKDLLNNYLIYTQYSYVTGNEIKSNFLVLKNQKTHKNYNYRSDYMEKNNPYVPTVDNRTYTGLYTGNDQEKGDYGITLSYEFYNADYKMVSDSYTIFYTPESIYPYKQININDLGWNYKGSIAGENPYLSDKIFQNKLDIKKSFGEYLCSWLYKRKNGETIWLDRYYLPDKTTYASALSTTFAYKYVEQINELLKTNLSTDEYYDVPYIYNSLQEEFDNTPQTLKNALYGITFFDKASDLVILPNKEYIYHRIGNKYVKTILDNIQNLILIDGLTLKNSNEATIYINTDSTEIEYSFNGNSYSLLENYGDINKYHEFTMSFWLNCDDWQKGLGHQIVGNLNDRGFALVNDEKITPIITIQNNKNVFLYNTDFSLLDVASLQNETINNTSVIRDLYRTDHLNAFYPINID